MQSTPIQSGHTPRTIGKLAKDLGIKITEADAMLVNHGSPEKAIAHVASSLLSELTDEDVEVRLIEGEKVAEIFVHAAYGGTKYVMYDEQIAPMDPLTVYTAALSLTGHKDFLTDKKTYARDSIILGALLVAGAKSVEQAKRDAERSEAHCEDMADEMDEILRSN